MTINFYLKNTDIIAAIPKTIIKIPAILLIHHSCFNLNFFLNRSTKNVSDDHQTIAPEKTPTTTNIELNELLSFETIPIPANAATKRNTAKGFDKVRNNMEK